MTLLYRGHTDEEKLRPNAHIHAAGLPRGLPLDFCLPLPNKNIDLKVTETMCFGTC